MANTLSDLDFQQVLRTAFNDEDGGFKMLSGSSLVPESYDELSLSYSSGDLVGVTYKKSGNTIATLTLTYDAPGGNLTNVVRS